MSLKRAMKEKIAGVVLEGGGRGEKKANVVSPYQGITSNK